MKDFIHNSETEKTYLNISCNMLGKFNFGKAAFAYCLQNPIISNLYNFIMDLLPWCQKANAKWLQCKYKIIYR